MYASSLCFSRCGIQEAFWKAEGGRDLLDSPLPEQELARQSRADAVPSLGHVAATFSMGCRGQSVRGFQYRQGLACKTRCDLWGWWGDVTSVEQMQWVWTGTIARCWHGQKCCLGNVQAEGKIIHLNVDTFLTRKKKIMKPNHLIHMHLGNFGTT